MTITNIMNDCHKSYTHNVIHKTYGRDITIIPISFVCIIGKGYTKNLRT